MQSNFDFLQIEFPVLFQIANTAEKYIYSDASSCLFKLGLFGETLVNFVLKFNDISPPEENTHANRIKLLKYKGFLPQEVDNILYQLRIKRNAAVHNNLADTKSCTILLEFAQRLGLWFMQVYGTQEVASVSFALPPQDTTDYAQIIQEQEKQITALLSQTPTTTMQFITATERKHRSNKAAFLINLSEEETRFLIDSQLRQMGWEVDTTAMRYSKGARPEKGKNKAIAEWPTMSPNGTREAVDYAFFVGLQLIAVAEAKKAVKDIPAHIDRQCKDYAKGIRPEDQSYMLAQWGGYKVPFVFATNGRKYLKQIETKSGIWFLDLRKRNNLPKALQAWPSPSGLMDWFAKDVDKANTTLQNSSSDFLKDPEGLNLRQYQLDAIATAEKSITDGAETALLAMATGTGKTRTILGLMYRLLESHRCKRILFLVDRNYLGTQAQDVFSDVRIKDLKTLNEIYNIKSLEDKHIDLETRVHVATVQSLVQRILYPNDDDALAVSAYDAIIIDEAHRGYVLDKQMDEIELESGTQENYISIYRTVVEYFNAIKIALTATPALHTTQIFGKPIYSYTYRDAVLDGYLVDHNAPHIIKTQLSTEGIHYNIGEVLTVYDPITGEVTNSAELEDELHFDIGQFNKQVITESFNREALKEIMRDLDPEGTAKTLIFAANDTHADLIVKILRELYAKYDIDQDAIQKITGSIGDQKRIRDAVKNFKNERYPNIVVTVDLLTTGVDIPTIANLVFLRRVRSRILFEQMLGRATRLCSSFKKEFFEIYDAVGVYQSLAPVNTMKPVVADPHITLSELLTSLESCTDEAHIHIQVDKIVAKMRRKSHNLTQDQYTHFIENNAGEDVHTFIDSIKTLPPFVAQQKILNDKHLVRILDEKGKYGGKPIVISDKKDKVTQHTRGYGDDAEAMKPEDYLEEFQAYIAENTAHIEALHLVCTRPASLSREALKSLRRELDEKGFTETKLNTAWNEVKNEDMAADIISFIRTYTLGVTLVSREEKIKYAIAKLKASHSFDKMQERWLDTIGEHLMREGILTKEILDLGILGDEGGFKRFNTKIFDNKLEEYIAELNEYLYADGERVA